MTALSRTEMLDPWIFWQSLSEGGKLGRIRKLDYRKLDQKSLTL